jgi:F0F1-type ATP synthase alpha subunit
VNVLEEKDAMSIQLLFQQVQMILLHYNTLLHICAALAEYHVQRKATLVIYDDLTKQWHTVKCHYYYVVRQDVKLTR